MDSEQIDSEQIDSEQIDDDVEYLPSLPMPTKNTINAEILTVKMKSVGNSSYSPFYVSNQYIPHKIAISLIYFRFERFEIHGSNNFLILNMKNKYDLHSSFILA